MLLSAFLSAEVRFVPQDGRTVHDAPVGLVVVDGKMLRTPVVPEGDVARPPAPAHGELRLLDVLVEEFEQVAALLAGKSVDPGGETEIDEEPRAAGLGMRADDGMG